MHPKFEIKKKADFIKKMNVKYPHSEMMEDPLIKRTFENMGPVQVQSEAEAQYLQEQWYLKWLEIYKLTEEELIELESHGGYVPERMKLMDIGDYYNLWHLGEMKYFRLEKNEDGYFVAAEVPYESEYADDHKVLAGLKFKIMNAPLRAGEEPQLRAIRMGENTYG